MNKKTLIKIVLSLILLLSTIYVAQAYSIPEELRPINEPFDLPYDADKGGIQGSTATIIILQIIAGGLLYFAAPVAIIFIGLAGFQIVTGGADSEKVEQGKKHLTWSVVGLLLIILSYSLVSFVIGFAIKSAEPKALPTKNENTNPPPTSHLYKFNHYAINLEKITPPDAKKVLRLS